jgi:cell division protein FtsB
MNRKKVTTKKKKITKLILPLFVAFIIATVLLTIQTATSGARIANLETKEEELAKENRELNDRLIRMSSLTKISEEADELGFVKPSDIIYLTPAEDVASR